MKSNVSIEDIFSYFDKAAYEYAKKHNQPAVLVIDNINLLAKKDPEMLEVLQEDAKSWADNQYIKVVFVTSEGKAPKLMKGKKFYSINNKLDQSAFSRAEIAEITDLSDTEAEKYLTNKKNIEESTAKKVVKEITGGRMLFLSDVATELNKGVPYESNQFLCLFL